MKKKHLIFSAGILTTTLIAFQSSRPEAKADVADLVLLHGHVLTVDDHNMVAQAIAIKGGKILAVGTDDEISLLKGSGTQVVDLAGKTVTPGFVDGHSHFMSLDRSNSVNVSAPPVGNVHNIRELVAAIAAFKKSRNIADGEWITAYGYDQDQLEEKRHPTKEDLDAAFPNNPITLTHVSGHMTVANSLALRLSGITASTPDPEGGVIVRKPGTKEPAGLLQEGAARLLKRPQKPKPSLEDQLQLVKDQELFYASNGITTAQDGYSSFESVELLERAAENHALFIDIEALPGFPTLDKVLANPQYTFGNLKNHLKLAGSKLVADGSPQGKTAYFTKAYLTEVPGCNHDICAGFPNVTQEQFNQVVLKEFEHNIRPFVHCNGDATIDMYIKAIENANQQLHSSSTSRRPVTIHSQFVRPDQLDDYKRLGIIPALFSNHAFFWGDVHIQNLGLERASFLSPLKSAMNKGLRPTNHTDYGVTPLNQLFLLWTSVERKTRSGKVVGAKERLTPVEGLRAITINGAYEYEEENLKGSIEKGKLADLVILSDDITRIDPDKIKDVKVLQTYKEGQVIYKAKQPS